MACTAVLPLVASTVTAVAPVATLTGASAWPPPPPPQPARSAVANVTTAHFQRLFIGPLPNCWLMQRPRVHAASQNVNRKEVALGLRGPDCAVPVTCAAMRAPTHPLCLLALGLAAAPAWAVDTSLTSAG